MIKKASLLMLSAFFLTGVLPVSAEDLKAGSVAPNFTLTTTDKKKVSLSDLKGKVLWVNFFATY
jgi:peroxiredoxin